MEIRLQKWGNSLGIRIPSTILKSNEKINLDLDDDRIIIKKKKKGKISLKERFNEYNGDDLTKEFSWDDARGREIW